MPLAGSMHALSWRAIAVCGLLVVSWSAARAQDQSVLKQLSKQREKLVELLNKLQEQQAELQKHLQQPVGTVLQPEQSPTKPRWAPPRTECKQPPKADYPTGPDQPCRIYKRACVDQETIIVFDPELVNKPTVPDMSIDLTNLNTFNRHHIPKHMWTGEHSHTIGESIMYHKLYVRLPGTHEQGLEGLLDSDGQPTYFSKCTVPVVIAQHWFMNIAEYLIRSIVYTWVDRFMNNITDSGITFALHNAAKEQLEPFVPFLLQPFSDHAVTSFADLSSRLPPDTPSNATAEGKHIRCFEKLVFCKYDGGRYPQVFEAGQFIKEYYTPSLPPLKPGFWDMSPDVMRIVIVRRTSSSNRQILNQQEVLDWCNNGGWKRTSKQPGVYKRTQCQPHTFGLDLLHDLAVVKDAEVFVYIHGSALANSVMLARHRSVIELRPKDMGTTHRWWPNLWYPLISDQNQYNVIFWGINLEKDGTWEEAYIYKNSPPPDGAPIKGEVALSRNVRLPLEALSEMLTIVADNDRNATRYAEEYWKANRTTIVINNTGIFDVELFAP